MCLGSYDVAEEISEEIAVTVFDFGLWVGIDWYHWVFIGFISTNSLFTMICYDTNFIL